MTSKGFDLTFGIEEEFFLVDARTRDLVPRLPASFLRACRSALGERVAEELLQPQIELTTPVLHGADEARDQLRQLRRQQVKDLFVSSGFTEYALSSEAGRDLENWVAAFEEKVRQIADRPPCPEP